MIISCDVCPAVVWSAGFLPSDVRRQKGRSSSGKVRLFLRVTLSASSLHRTATIGTNESWMNSCTDCTHWAMSARLVCSSPSSRICCWVENKYLLYWQPTADMLKSTAACWSILPKKLSGGQVTLLPQWHKSSTSSIIKVLLSVNNFLLSVFMMDKDKLTYINDTGCWINTKLVSKVKHYTA